MLTPSPLDSPLPATVLSPLPYLRPPTHCALAVFRLLTSKLPPVRPWGVSRLRPRPVSLLPRVPQASAIPARTAPARSASSQLLLSLISSALRAPTRRSPRWFQVVTPHRSLSQKLLDSREVLASPSPSTASTPSSPTATPGTAL